MKNMRHSAYLIVLSLNCSRLGKKLKSSMVERNMSKFERWINEFNPEKNSNLNAGVLLRSCTKIVKPCTLNSFT